MAQESSFHSPYHEEYIQGTSGNTEDLYYLTHNSPSGICSTCTVLSNFSLHN